MTSPDARPDLRPIESHPGYHVGADGFVYSTKASPGAPRRLRARPHHRTGHLRVRLYGPGAPSRAHNGRRARFVDAYVHVLVCTAHHGPPPFAGAMVLHDNGNPADNRPGNLRWGTGADNNDDTRRHTLADAAAAAHYRRGLVLDDGPGATADRRWGF